MIRLIKICLVGGLGSLASLSTLNAAEPGTLRLLPQPREIQSDVGAFVWKSDLAFSGTGFSDQELGFFAEQIRRATGWEVPVRKRGSVHWTKDAGLDGGYRLEVKKDRIEIRAGDYAAAFYAFQSLRQLGPSGLFAAEPQASLKSGWSVPCVTIQDSPRFRWRGVLVDVSRHFQSKQEMMRLLDAMASVKLNVLHWHLTDDQGWRPEIKAYPKLTAGGKPHYSQQDLREVVAYASQRGIMIVPEIDVPGHSGAVARAYPELCVAKADGKGRHNVYNVAKPEVYQFLDTVFKELAAIFPSEYIHLGADEVGMRAWRQDKGVQHYMAENKIRSLHELQSVFVGKVSDLIRKHGRKPIAWDEALAEDADKGLTIMSWRGVQPGIKAAKAGHHVILCPVSALYYDRTQSRSKKHPRGYSNNTVGLSQSYFFEPAIPTLAEPVKKRILGAQGCVWGEKITGGDHLQRQVMLRGAALAEALWSPREKLDWADFQKRLKLQRERLDAMGIPYWWEPASTPRLVAEWDQIGEGQNERVVDISESVNKAGLYEFLFHYRMGAGSFQISQCELLVDGKVVARDEHPYTATVEPRRPNQYYRLKLPEYQAGKRYQLRYRIAALHGGCQGVVMMVPALEPDQYGPDRLPDSTANQTNQKQPDEL